MRLFHNRVERAAHEILFIAARGDHEETPSGGIPSFRIYNAFRSGLTRLHGLAV